MELKKKKKDWSQIYCVRAKTLGWEMKISIGGMAIQRPFLIEGVTDEANTVSKNKQTIEHANLNLRRLVSC